MVVATLMSFSWIFEVSFPKTHSVHCKNMLWVPFQLFTRWLWWAFWRKTAFRQFSSACWVPTVTSLWFLAKTFLLLLGSLQVLKECFPISFLSIKPTYPVSWRLLNQHWFSIYRWMDLKVNVRGLSLRRSSWWVTWICSQMCSDSRKTEKVSLIPSISYWFC